MAQYSSARLDASFSALSDATRRGVLEQLGRADASITDLAEKFHMTLTGMKKHVGVLEQAGLVATEKVGRVRSCKLGPLRLEPETAWIERYRERLGTETRDDAERALAMNRVNPKYVLRNYLAQRAIGRAVARDWSEIERSLWAWGYAKTAPVLTPEECAALVAMYGDEARFRSQVDMARYRFGVGDYKYFAAPLPPLVQALRTHAYPPLAAIARTVSSRVLRPLARSASAFECVQTGARASAAASARVR